MPQNPVYGLDIETTHAGATAGPLDPGRSPITRAALSTPSTELVFDGDERALLVELDETIAQLEPGILATWNGAGFDLPYLADRAAASGIQLGLHLAADPRLRPRGEALRGHVGAYRAAWYGHRHLDAARLFRSGRRPLIEVDELLRAIGLRGWGRHIEGPADAPGEELTHEAAYAFAANDARLVRSMVERRLPSALRHVDRVEVATSKPVPEAVTTRRTGRVPLSPAHPAVRAMLTNRS